MSVVKSCDKHPLVGAGDLAGEQRLPMSGRGGVSRLGENLGRGRTCGSGKALDQSGETPGSVTVTVRGPGRSFVGER